MSNTGNQRLKIEEHQKSFKHIFDLGRPVAYMIQYVQNTCIGIVLEILDPIRGIED